MEISKARASWIEYVVSQPECNFTVTQKPLTASFTHPGLDYSSIDRDGRVDIFNLLSCLADIRYISIGYPYRENQDKWFQWREVRQDRSIFVSSIHVVLSRNMHNEQVPKWPLQVTSTLGYVGKSSLSMSFVVCSSSSPEPLLTHIIQYVGVDTKTRKPKPFPDWFINKFSEQCSILAGLRIDTFLRPAETFMYKREVLWLETDINNHTNHASYVRYALDGLYAAIHHQGAAGVAASSAHSPGSSNAGSLQSVAPILQTKRCSGGLREGLRDIIQDGLQSLNIRYVTECLEGDIIDIHIWQEEDDAYIIRCSIEKESKLICQITLEYFAPLAKL